MLLVDPVCLRRVLPRLSDGRAQIAPADVEANARQSPFAPALRVAAHPKLSARPADHFACAPASVLGYCC